VKHCLSLQPPFMLASVCLDCNTAAGEIRTRLRFGIVMNNSVRRRDTDRPPCHTHLSPGTMRRTAAMNPKLRDQFDRHLEAVLDQFPESVRRLLEKVPLHVEDYPPADVLARTGITCRETLCGLYTGIPLTERSVQHTAPLPDVVTIYREGILSLARTPRGSISTEALREQIRVTVLHELGHHHGLTETDLTQLGYG
jgi:predicted Zn-dependent protease with MMP-like domain